MRVRTVARMKALEEKALRKLGDEYMAYSNAELSKLVQERLIVEVRCHEQNS